MWRDKIVEVKSAKGISTRALAETSGVSIDTIYRFLKTDTIIKEGPNIETLAAICGALGIELWELFYVGDKSFVGVQAELTAIKAEREELIAENAVLKSKLEAQRTKIESLKDEIIATHRHYIKLEEAKKE